MTATDNDRQTTESCDVVIIGGGPSGLAAATHLKQAGVDSVVVLEREPEAGGIPRHCGHPPFGMREFHTIKTGPRYAKALVDEASRSGVDIRLNTSVTHLHEGGCVSVSTDEGYHDISAKRVILCTGVRETPRSARLISGGRPLGIYSTGALQSMVYLKDTVPFRRPFIIGTELVSFSALLTCRHAHIKPVAMIESNERITARAFCRPLPMILGVPLHLNTRLAEILGKERVNGVRTIDKSGREQVFECDGVLFTGRFTPESSLLRMSHLAVDANSGGPVVDQFGRCSDPSYFATGNLLRPVETAGWCWNEGRRTASAVARSLEGQLPEQTNQIRLRILNPKLKYVIPQVFSMIEHPCQNSHIQLRFNEPALGTLSIESQGKTIWSRKISALPERRVLIPVAALASHLKNASSLDINFHESD